MKRNRLAVIGIGNILLGDEGAGLHTIEKLRDRKFSREVDLIEAGTPGMNLLHQFEERDTIIFVDSGNCGLKTGEFSKFRPDEVRSLKENPGHSLHEFDLISFIKSAGKLGKTENVDIIIYCIQSGDMKMSLEPGNEVKTGITRMSEQIYSDIEKGEYDHA